MPGWSTHRPGVRASSDLDTLVREMSPERQPGHFVFVTVQELPDDVDVVASVREEEGLSLVIPQDEADQRGLAYELVGAWITLRVHSALDAVGLTAAVAGTLADAGISCNVVAGHHHDHLFVPADRADDALRLLSQMSASAKEQGAT